MHWFNAKHGKTGTDDKTVRFSHAIGRENIKSGEKHSKLFGKIARYFEDLKMVAFTGNYNDLSNKPSIPAAVRIKGNAETTYKTGDVNVSPASIGLGNVNNTADKDKSVKYAASAGAVSWSEINNKPSVVETTSKEGVPCILIRDWCCISEYETPTSGMNQICMFINGDRDGGIKIGFYYTHAIHPLKDNNTRLGCEAYRWKQVYAVNAAISTSDRREKKDISYIGEKSSYDTYMDDETLVKFIMGLMPVVYRWIKNDSNRPHHGLIAQDVEKLLENLGIPDHAAFIKSPLYDTVQEEIETDAIDENGSVITDENGDVIKTRQTIEKQVHNGEYRYGLRYEEFTADIMRFCQILYNKDQDLETRMQDLETRVSVLENSNM